MYPLTIPIFFFLSLENNRKSFIILPLYYSKGRYLKFRGIRYMYFCSQNLGSNLLVGTLIVLTGMHVTYDYVIAPVCSILGSLSLSLTATVVGDIPSDP